METLIGKDIEFAIDFLKSGHVIGMPTETVYGLAGNALNTSAVLNIFKIKNRPSFDPLIVHISSPDKLHLYTENVPKSAGKLMDALWPGPVTFLLKKKVIIPDIVTSGSDRVAIRIPSHPLTSELLNNLDFPLAAPSANPFGYISPTSAQHVSDQLSGKIPYILDGGKCTVGIESTIIGFENDTCIVYRLGGISIERIEKIVGNVIVKNNSSSNPNAPGMLESHYAPKTPLYLGELKNLTRVHDLSEVGILSFTPNPIYNNLAAENLALSQTGDLDEAAQNLFSYLRILDKSGVKKILAEILPESGLGRAMNDRLQRAAIHP